MPGEIFRIQAEIAEQVAGALNVTLLEPERQAIVANWTEDREAHNEYLLGKFHGRNRTPDRLQLAAEHFNRAIARDSNFARAYSGLADAYVLFPRFGAPGFSRAEAYARAEQAALRAIELDDTLADAHASLGQVRMRRSRDWAGAEQEFLRAIDLDPSCVEAHGYYALYLWDTGRLEEAMEQAQRTLALDPLRPGTRAQLGLYYYMSGRLDQALEELLKAVELEPTYQTPHLHLMVLYVDQGLLDEAVRELEFVGFPKEFARTLIKALLGQNSQEVAAAIIAKAQGALGHVIVGVMYSKVGLNDHAFTSFEEAFRLKDDNLPDIIRHKWLDGLRSDPRYADLLRRMGLK
jgi:tetratricopeptide (TPR) repeat protein